MTPMPSQLRPRHCHYFIPRLPPRNLPPRLHHHSRYLKSRNKRISRHRRIQPLHTHHIRKVHRRRLHLDLHLILLRLSHLPSPQPHFLQSMHRRHYQSVLPSSHTLLLPSFFLPSFFLSSFLLSSFLLSSSFLPCWPYPSSSFMQLNFTP